MRVMTPIEELESVSAETDGDSILAILASGKVRRVFVMEGGLIRGVISRKDIHHYVQLHTELEKK